MFAILCPFWISANFSLLVQANISYHLRGAPTGSIATFTVLGATASTFGTTMTCITAPGGIKATCKYNNVMKEIPFVETVFV